MSSITFFTSNKPEKAKGFLGSWTGNREYPLNSLFASCQKVASNVYFLVIYVQGLDHFCVQDGVRTDGDDILPTPKTVSYTKTSIVASGPTFIGVMILSTLLVLSSRTPFRMLISSSRRGSSPVRWNCKNDFSSAFLYVCTSLFPRT